MVTGFPGGSVSKESTCDVGDMGSIPGLGRSPAGGHGSSLQYSCLENPHEQWSLVGYSPWGHKELDMTEWLSTYTILILVSVVNLYPYFDDIFPNLLVYYLIRFSLSYYTWGMNTPNPSTSKWYFAFTLNNSLASYRANILKIIFPLCQLITSIVTSVKSALSLIFTTM